MKTRNKGPGTKENKETRQGGTDRQIGIFSQQKKQKNMVITHSDFKKLSDQEQKEIIQYSILKVLIITQKLETTVNKYFDKTNTNEYMEAHLLAEKINKENRNVVRLVRFYQLIQNNKKK